MRSNTLLLLSLILFPVFELAQPKLDSKEIKMFFGQDLFMEKEVIEINVTIKKQKTVQPSGRLGILFPFGCGKGRF
jgi:hypothetical protein